MTKEEIATLAVKNDLVEDVYEILHFIILAKLNNLTADLSEANTNLKLIKKFADIGRLDVIQDILRGDKE